MTSAQDQLEVFGGVILPVVVLVMNAFVLLKSPPDEQFHRDDVLPDIRTFAGPRVIRCVNMNVPVPIKSPSALPSRMLLACFSWMPNHAPNSI